MKFDNIINFTKYSLAKKYPNYNITISHADDFNFYLRVEPKTRCIIRISNNELCSDNDVFVIEGITQRVDMAINTVKYNEFKKHMSNLNNTRGVFLINENIPENKVILNSETHFKIMNSLCFDCMRKINKKGYFKI